MMNKLKLFTVIFLAVMLNSLSTLVVRVSSESNPIFTVRDTVLSYFYPASGVIVTADKEIVEVNFLSSKGLKTGMRFSVFREGKPFYHPVTKEPIGKTEEYIGKIEIQKLADESTPTPSGGVLYKCRVVNGNPAKGDIARITSSKIKLAYFQNSKVDWTISEVFHSSLQEAGRFDVLDTYSESYEPKNLSALAKKAGADAVLLFSTPQKMGNIFINVKIFWSEDSVLLAEAEEKVGPELLKEFASENEPVSMGKPEGEPWASHMLAKGEFIAVGDVDGNGEKELVVSDSNDIRIYTYKDEPREIWLIRGFSSGRHISIDVLDVNGNGRAEIFVTSLKDNSMMSSFVLEYDPREGYRRTADKLNYAFRVIGKNLLMQAFTPFTAFKGPVYEGKWSESTRSEKDGLYQTTAPLKLPEYVNIYGFTYVNWLNNGHQQLLAFDDSGYLNLYDGNISIWKSKDSYGKFDLSFDKKNYSVVEETTRWVVKGRLITINAKRGQEVIVIKKIPVIARIPGLGYKSAEVYSMWWDGGMMDETLILEGIKGTVMDYWVEGNSLFILASANISTFFSKALSGNFLRGSILYYYNLEGK